MMKLPALQILAASFFLMFVGSLVSANAQEDLPPIILPTRGTPLGSISGRVVLPSGHPVNGRVRVTLSSQENPGFPNYSDNNGGFAFPNLHEGTYTIEVTGDTAVYESVTETVRVIRGNTFVTIYLKEKAKPEGTSGHVVSAAELDKDVPSLAKKEYDAGSELVKKGQTKEAIQRFKRALEIYPDYLMARNDLGVQYLKLEQLTEAQEQFEYATEKNPKAFNPRLNLGIVLVMQKRYNDGLEHLRIADSIDGSSAAVHLYIGIASEETDELADAERELLKALSMGGEGYQLAHFYLGLLNLKKGEEQQAIAELNAFLATGPLGLEAKRARELLAQLKKG